MSATVIDSLILKLGIDAKGLTSQAPAASKNLKQLEAQGKDTEQEIKKIGSTSKDTATELGSLTKAVGSFLALIGGTMAIKRFISDQIESNAQLYRFSKNLGLSVSTVSAWGNAVEEMGGSAQGLQGTLDMLSKSQTELRLTGQSALIPYFSALGVSLANVRGQARPVDEILLDLSDRFSHMDRTTANNMGRMMGIDQDTLNLLLQGRKEVELMIARQKETNAVTKQQAEQSAKLQRQLVDLKQTFTATGRALLSDAAPALEKVLGWLMKLGDWVSVNREFVGDFLKVVAVGIGAIAIAALPLDGVVVGIMAVGAAIAALWQDYQVWKRGGDSFVDWGVWKDRIDGVTNSLTKLRTALTTIADKTRTATGNADSYLKKKFSAYKALDNFYADQTTNQKLHQKLLGFLGLNTSGTPATSAQAMAQAQRVSGMTGIPADILYSQWAHETGNFTNRGAKSLNNLAGVNVPGGKGQDYRSFKSLDDFGDYYAYLMRSGGRYDAARSAKTPEDFAGALKAGGYYSDSQSNYAGDMRRYFNGIHGASSGIAAAGASPSGSGAGDDRSVTNHIGEINIHTAATDAPGIARGMDFLFASQANAGLN